MNVNAFVFRRNYEEGNKTFTICIHKLLFWAHRIEVWCSYNFILFFSSFFFYKYIVVVENNNNNNKKLKFGTQTSNKINILFSFFRSLVQFYFFIFLKGVAHAFGIDCITGQIYAFKMNNMFILITWIPCVECIQQIENYFI